MNRKEFEEYVKELRRLGFTRKKVFQYYLEKKECWKVTREQAIRIINAC